MNRAIAVGILALLISFTSGALAQEGRVIISTNRFVVLDDSNSGTKAPGFFDPTEVRGGSWGTDYWNGESTTIRASALLMDGRGSPRKGVAVNFTLRNPGGAVRNTTSSLTDSKGVAYYTFNLNEQRYWGYWNIEAEAARISVKNSSSFVLYWWGCGQCHKNEAPGKWGTRYTPKSYYTMGYDFHKSQTKTKHTDAMAKGACIMCHQMYNGTPVNYRLTENSPKIGQDKEYSPDWHSGKAMCQDCHAGSNISTTPQGKNPDIAGCYDTKGCHSKKNANLTPVNSTSGYSAGGNYRTNYSSIPDKAVKAHNVSGIPCIICHKAGHNISKPYNTTGTSNSYTEYQQCTACHLTYSKHNDSVNCTVCHSQDAHVIKTFSRNATYIAAGAGSQQKGNCTSCHQNLTFFKALTSLPGSGSFAGKIPIIAHRLNHSDDASAGRKWNTTPGYWTPGDQAGACLYCHGNTSHNSKALGYPSLFSGNNTMNATISSSGTWCSSCHWQGYPYYSVMVQIFKSAAAPPEISGNASYAPKKLSGYIDHTAYGKDDLSCRGCHGGSKTYITEFMHGISSFEGENCIECHGTGYAGASPSATRTFVNISAFNRSIHRNINATPPNKVNDHDCLSCHYLKDMDRRNIRKCGYCHRKPQQWHGYANITTNLSGLW